MPDSTKQRQPKVTYSAIGGDLDQLHAAFEAALHDAEARFGVAHHPHIDGTQVVGSAASYESRSPIDRSRRLATFTAAGREQVDAAVSAAKHAQRAWGALSWRERIARVQRAAELIRERRYDIAAVVSLEIGKTRFEALGDTEEAADLIDYYASQIEEHDGFSQPLGQLAPNEVTRDVLRPYGVFAVIAPFNFPISLATGMTGAALLTGNTVVFKPAESASLVGAQLAQAYNDAGLPKGVFNIIYGNSETTGKPLTQHPAIDGIAFTGSREVGMHLLQSFGAGGRHAKPVLAELGGKNAAIVTASADLEMAGEGVMRSAFGLQGQKCSACSRVYVDRRVADAFLALLLEKTRALIVGDPTRREVYVGPVIDEAAFRRFETAVRDANQGGKLLYGGERVTTPPLDRGFFVQPTIVQLPLEHALFGRELFLPLLSVGIVDSFDEALRESNRSEYGLTGGLFSNDESEIERFFDEAEAGVLYVNRRTGATTGAWPGVQSFCGWKGSGVTGRGGCGPYYPAQFMREQSRTRML